MGHIQQWWGRYARAESTLDAATTEQLAIVKKAFYAGVSAMNAGLEESISTFSEHGPEGPQFVRGLQQELDDFFRDVK